jgi:hypothetical protein
MGYTYPARDPFFFQHISSDFSTKQLKISRHSREIEEGLVDGVTRNFCDMTLQNRHHSVRHISKESVVRGKGNDAVSLELILHLEVWLSHFYVGFGVGAARYNRPVVVAQNNDWCMPKIRPEDSLAGCVKAISICECEDR